MDRQTKAARLKTMLEQVAPGDSVESLKPMAEAAVRRMPTDFAGGAEDVVRPPDRALEAIDSGLVKVQEGREQDLTDEEMFGVEAIILPKTRPVAFVRNATYADLAYPWQHLNDDNLRNKLRPAIASIGRIELPNMPQLPYGGTGFIVGKGLLMTNRHVAEIFVEGLGVTRLRYRTGDAAVDFTREAHTPEDDRAAYFDVIDVLMVHPYWDMALLRIDGVPATFEPLTLSTTPPEDLMDKDVAAVGYPARDDRNDLAVQDRIFDRRYNVKRFQPGKIRPRAPIRSFETRVEAMTHDSSTLGRRSPRRGSLE